MTDKLEQQMHEAFDRTHMPAGLAERTLAHIETQRQAGAAVEWADEMAAHAPQTASEPARLSVVNGAAEQPRTRARRRFPLVAALAACLVLVAVGVVGVAWAWQPYAYVAIDVNPSIELGINRLDRVASTKAYNEDGAEVLAIANVEGDTYEEAMTAIEGALATYLDSSSAIELTIVCDDRNVATQLESVGTHCLDQDGTGQVHCSHASEEDHEQAAVAGLGVGKYRVYRALADAGVDITADEAGSMTMRELLDLAAANGVELSWHDIHEAEGHTDSGEHEGSSAPAAGQGQGSGAGNGNGNNSGQASVHHGEHAGWKDGHHDE